MKQLFESLLNRYCIELKTSMKGSSFVLDFVNYKYQKINLKRGGGVKNGAI